MADAARSIGLPPLVYPLRHLAHDETVPRVLCRYLNSGIPVTIAARSHAVVLVGYERTCNSEDKELLHFVCHDDEIGPYRVVDWKLDEHGPWEYAIFTSTSESVENTENSATMISAALVTTPALDAMPPTIASRRDVAVIVPA